MENGMVSGNATDESGYTILQGTSVTPEHIAELLQLDYAIYDDLYHIEPGICIGYHKKNPDIYIVALKENKVVGYINFSPISDNAYERIRRGEVDTFLTADDILEYRPGKEYSVYFSSICVHPEYQHKGIAGIMLDRLHKLVESLEARDIHIKRIVADACTRSGENIAKNNGFSLVAGSNHGSKIMEVKTKEKTMIVEGFKKTMEDPAVHQKKAALDQLYEKYPNIAPFLEPDKKRRGNNDDGEPQMEKTYADDRIRAAMQMAAEVASKEEDDYQLGE